MKGYTKRSRDSESPSQKHTDENLTRDHLRSKRETINNEMHTSLLMDLFEEQLRNILWGEKALTKALSTMITFARSDKLIVVLTDHLQQTNKQTTRLTNVFETIGKKPNTMKSDAIEGLIAEASGMMKSCEKGPQCDAAIIAAAQKIEHYEIAAYGTLREFAETLGLREAEMLLIETLKEEKETDKRLTNVATHGVNMEAASKQMSELSNHREYS